MIAIELVSGLGTGEPLSPSLAIILHSERSEQRYVLIAEAIQPCPDDCIGLTATVLLVTPT